MKKLLILLCAAGTLCVFAAGLPFKRVVDDTQISVGSRPRANKDMLFFAEAQLKYGMYQNFLHYWIDRPLFWNRATRPANGRFDYMTKSSFAVDMKLLELYGLNGLGSFGTPRNKFVSLKRADEYLCEFQLPNVSHLAQITYGETGAQLKDNEKQMADFIKYALESPHMAKIGGKTVFGTYNYRLNSAAQHRAQREKLKKILGRDDYLIMGDIPFRPLKKMQQDYIAKGSITTAQQKELYAMLEEGLRSADGLQLNVSFFVRPMEGPYISDYDVSFFEKYTKPMLMELLNKPAFKDKVLGFQLTQGYINHMSGMNHGEWNTRTLRRQLNTALKCNPDYLLFFEWNEANENTSFQPSVYNSMAIQRLLRYYTSTVNGKPLSGNPGDDLSVPNLIATWQVTAKCGELMSYELLNVPDGSKGRYTARLVLNDLQGKELAAFPEEEFDAARLRAVTYTLPTETLPAGTVIVPRLTVKGKEISGLQSVRIDPTIRINYKTARQPVRDLAKGEAKLEVTALGNNRYAVKGSFAGSEPLASLELLDQEDIVRAAGAEKEYDQEKNVVLRIAFTAPPGKSFRSTGKILWHNVSKAEFHSYFLANVDPGRWQYLKEGNGIKNSFAFWSQECAYFLTLPRGEAAKAELEIILDKLPKLDRIPVAPVLKHGLYSRVLKPETGLRVEITEMKLVPDLPNHLKTASASIEATVSTDHRLPLYSLRAITESGKIFRSKPIQAGKISKEMQQYNVFSEWQKRAITVSTPKNLLPVISCIFHPDCGAGMVNTWGRFHDGQLGGGFYYSEAFSTSTPKVADGDRAPQWVRDGNQWVLQFDGVNDYVNFTRETLPNGVFTITFEVKPEYVRETQVLFRHFNRILGSISLFMRHGKLYASFGQKDVTQKDFDTSLTLPYDKWSTVTVHYDLKQLSFTVNGKTQSFPMTGRAYTFKSLIFGGHDKIEFSPKEPLSYFKGLLRKLEIRHY